MNISISTILWQKSLREKYTYKEKKEFFAARITYQYNCVLPRMKILVGTSMRRKAARSATQSRLSRTRGSLGSPLPSGPAGTRVIGRLKNKFQQSFKKHVIHLLLLVKRGRQHTLPQSETQVHQDLITPLNRTVE